MKQLVLFILFMTAFTISSFSQDFEVPENYKLKKKSDFDKYEPQVLQCIDWLMNTPFNKDYQKRKKANGFLLDWATGSPKVTISLDEKIVNFMDKNPDLLVIFIGGWVKYSLTNNNFTDHVSACVAGVEAVTDFYTKNLEYLNKDKNVEKYIKMKSEGTLKAFVEKNISKK